jgi:acyl dehydratase
VPLNLDAVGKSGQPSLYSWTKRDAMLYALAVGAGQRDPQKELEFTTENSSEIELKVLPSFINLVTRQPITGVDIGEVDRTNVLHAEQEFELHRPLPAEGSVRSVGEVVGIYDKGKAALLVVQMRSFDVESGEPIATCKRTTYIRGEGGFGGDRGPADEWEPPSGAPDVQVSMPTRPDQALLYRLTGDTNPLHADPVFAKRAGFDRPILHGMCTYGFTARALLHAICGSDVERWVSMRGRFSTPVFPGDVLTVDAWIDGSTARFRTSTDAGIVIDRGVLRYKG